MQIKIVIFASGSGTNAENIIEYFKGNSLVSISKVICNKKEAKVVLRAKKHNVPSQIITKEELHSDEFLNTLEEQADLIVLAGFLLKIPDSMVETFPDKIINIHPALLPKYGGKGMYGMHVHKAVVANKESESGITIHYVNEHYDEGAIIFQKRVALQPTDTPEMVAEKIHELEQENFPRVIDELVIPKL